MAKTVEPPSSEVWENGDPSTLPSFLRNRHREVQELGDDEEDDNLDLKWPSMGGHGTLEALEVSHVLEDAGIVCCFTGTSALIYYGAGRIRDDWDICVPSEQMHEAELLLKSEAHAQSYVSVRPRSTIQPGSLRHTSPRFRARDSRFYFVLVPSGDIHLALEPSSIQRSHHGLPYPELHILIQSFLEAHDQTSLVDVVDGSDVSEAWGEENLDLVGPTDVAWAIRKNKAIMSSIDTSPFGGGVPTRPVEKRELWRRVASNKTRRLGWTTPPSLFSTRFRMHGTPDPWLEPRDCS